eukprot:CAMPEP_0119055656 /NCGR_PEP_ID=MMETSP1177-20130426/75854_1 /TAXON_ID=2985 /ORGANISM="Ochromonas sp, Strain CCMP1899" /LENGTH=339 /DNA_ID=CAMNT_0007036241 /DNA_START=96 /DNA_END=1116 /DNA_ORIENTATION=+
MEKSVEDSRRRIEDLEEECAQCREEREHFRRKILDLEGVHESASNADNNEEINRLTQELDRALDRLKELDTKNKSIEINEKEYLSDIKGLKRSLEEAQVSLDMKNDSEELMLEISAHKSTILDLQQSLGDSNVRLNSYKQESDAKVEVLSEKCKRMKNLLAKSKLMAQEKELELSKLAELVPAENRPKRLSIQTRLNLPVYDGSDATELWCVIIEDSAPGAAMKSEGVIFVLERTVRQWEVEGSTVIGTYPEILQDVWDEKMKNLNHKLDDDMTDLRKELEEVNLNFNAYKSRAQTALKRLGTDDRNERQKEQQDLLVLEEHNDRILELENQIKKQKKN